jgi:hypothetical protein
MCNRSLRRAMLGFVAVLGLAGCGGSAERLSSNGAGGATGVGDPPHDVDGAAGESPGDAARDAAVGGRPPDFERLEACPVAMTCFDSFAQLIEGSGRNINVKAVTCVLESLRDRTSGKYVHKTPHSFGNGESGANHLLMVGNDGRVKYARDRYRDLFLIRDGSAHRAPDPYAGFEPGHRCQLKPPNYFEGCIEAMKSPQASEAWACAFGDGTPDTPSTLFWFESCIEESPLACE